MKSGRLMTEEDALFLLDAQHNGWRRDREGWVTVDCLGIAWRVHYLRGQLVELGWWGTLGGTPGLRGGGRVAIR